MLVNGSSAYYSVLLLSSSKYYLYVVGSLAGTEQSGCVRLIVSAPPSHQGAILHYELLLTCPGRSRFRPVPCMGLSWEVHTNLFACGQAKRITAGAGAGAGAFGRSA